MNVLFKNLPNNELTNMGLSSDIVNSIICDDVPVGIVYLTENIDATYIEWIEFTSVFQSKHLLRPVMEKLYEIYGKLKFESQEDLKKKYSAIGAECIGIDVDREMFIWEYALP